MKVNPLETHVNKFIAESYAAFCALPPERLKIGGTIQQTTIPVDGPNGRTNVLLNFGIYGGKFSAYAALLENNESSGSAGFTRTGNYGLVSEVSEKLQVQQYEEDPERIKLRQDILASMLDAVGSATVGLSPSSLKDQYEIARISPFKVVDIPGAIPSNSIEVLTDSTDRILNLIRAIADDPNSQVVKILEELVQSQDQSIGLVNQDELIVSIQGHRTTIYYPKRKTG